MRYIAWLVAGSTLALTIAKLFLDRGFDPVGVVVQLVTLLGLTGVGLVVVTRRRNAIGWLLLAVGWLLAASNLLVDYADLADRGLADLARGSWAGWLGALMSSSLTLLGVTFIPLLFPTGHLLSKRWKPVFWLAIAATATVSAEFFDATRWDREFEWEHLDYPLGFSLSPQVSSAMQEVVAPILAAALFILLFANVAIRFRRSRGIERQQFKWVGIPAVFLVLVGVFSILDIVLQGSVELVTQLALVFWVVGFLSLPVGIGMALLRYRLYDIDRIVSRTVSYAIVVSVLAGVFLAVVMAAQAILPSGSDLAVAASTLAVAALFNPLRRRVQGLVDRRFNRSRYDAETELGKLVGRLRDAHDLDEITTEMIHIVTGTMQPATFGVWVRD